MDTLKVKLDDIKLLPVRAHYDDAGLDLRAKEDYLLSPMVRTLIDTGVSVEIPLFHVGLLISRSSLSKSNIIMTNSVGVIDSSYRGNLMVSLMYLGDKNNLFDHKHISKHERIAQLLVVPIALPAIEVVNSWNTTSRGVNGFGSTGRF